MTALVIAGDYGRFAGRSRATFRCPLTNPANGESGSKQECAVRKPLHSNHYTARDDGRRMERPGPGARELDSEMKPLPRAEVSRRYGAESASTDVPGKRFKFKPIALSLPALHRD